MSNSNLKRQTRKAVIQYAFMRWESAMVIGGTILLTYFIPQPFPGWPMWGWPVLGGFALLILVISTLTDQQSKTQVHAELVQEQYNPRNLHDPVLQREIEHALDAQRTMLAYASQQHPSALKNWLEDRTQQIAPWVEHVYALAVQLDQFRHDPLLAQERDAMPRELESLTARRQQEDNVDVQQQLDEVIASKRKQWESLQSLDDRMEQASRTLEQSNIALATVCSEVQRINAHDLGSNHSEHLRQEIKDHITQLRDVVSNLNDVYDYQGS